MLNKVYIAQSLDGHIADRNGGLDWLEKIAIPEGEDMGYQSFMESVDALLMGRNTFEKVASFDIEWPYAKPVYVLSTTLTEVDQKFEGKVILINAEVKDAIAQIREAGHKDIYIDGGVLIQSCLWDNLIDELIITTMPVLLGGGPRLFGDLIKEIDFELLESKVFVNAIVQNHYRRSK